MTHEQRYEIFQYGLRSGGIFKEDAASTDFWKVFTWGNAVGRTNQRGQGSIKLFHVHRTLIAKAFEHRTQAIELCVGQCLLFHRRPFNYDSRSKVCSAASVLSVM